MARKLSVVLTPAETKAKAKDLKDQIKGAKALVKTHTDALKAAAKKHTVENKCIQKDVDTASKALAKLEAELAALTPAPAAV